MNSHVSYGHRPQRRACGTELNCSLTFDHATVRKPEGRGAFLHAIPETKERLLKGVSLYKWTEYPLVGRNPYPNPSITWG